MHEAEIMENGQNGSARTFTSHFKDKQTTAIMNIKKKQKKKNRLKIIVISSETTKITKKNTYVFNLTALCVPLYLFTMYANELR